MPNLSQEFVSDLKKQIKEVRKHCERHQLEYFIGQALSIELSSIKFLERRELIEKYKIEFLTKS